MLRRHPRLTSFALRFLAIVVALAVLDRLVPDLTYVLRILVAVAVSLVVGAYVDRWLGITGGRDRANGPPGQS